MLHLTPLITTYILLITALTGLVMGSFSNCLAWRLAHGEHIARGRSHCAVCGHELSARELVPVLSWLVQRGKCLHCGEKISVRYPLTELLSAICFIGLVLRYDVTWTTLFYLVLTVILLAIALVDLDTGLIPDRLLLAGAVNFLLLSLVSGGGFFPTVVKGLFNAVVILIPLLLLVLVMDKALGQESMGGGDLKLYFVLGLYFHWTESIFLILLSSILGIVFFLIFRGKRLEDNAKAIPFGPAVSAAAYIALLAAGPVISWYLSLF